ncbi:tRNA pseudouridine synthase A 1-like isoform X4 [Coffea eugenioides]|uniref:tRNA pseudouridine synthase A 1-like isoform X4 n=1 Tax=Coffea eugenioides TaxID=49369 RepID=UPI000F605F67|nr:tRNA pseudouridine synthase A 1-like isoform X4 [Coffea eugenioides]
MLLLLQQFPSLPSSGAASFPPPFQNVQSAFLCLRDCKRPPLPVLSAFSSGPKNWCDWNEDNANSSPFDLPAYKWRLVIAYDGTRFSGWQYQRSTPTIQCYLEDALTKITKLERENLHLVGAGRTDAGVHAWGQVAHFITPFNLANLDDVHKALNGLLPSDIRIREIGAAIPEFHARFSVTSKIYHYKIYCDAIMDPFQRHYAFPSVYKLNPDTMRDAAKHFVGRHDFTAFANGSRNDRVPDPVKIIFRFDVIEMGHLLQLEVEGTGFLYRQVRNMVALLLQVGMEAVPSDIVPMILASRDRKELAKFALSVPPQGLCLVAIKYKPEHLHPPADAPTSSFGRHRSIGRCKLPCF